MSIMKPYQQFRTWVEINRNAALYNVAAFRSLIPKTTKLMSVVKSNAYGHGILTFPRIVKNHVDWFGVDSITEGLSLKKQGIKNPVFVLGATLESRLEEAARRNVVVTVSNFDILKKALRLKRPPGFHLKFDTGMHRQGFMESDLPALLKTFRMLNSESRTFPLCGAYTHFARAKGQKPDRCTHAQLKCFLKIAEELRPYAGKDFISHASATAGALMVPHARLDMVRIGIGLYGLWPSRDVRAANKNVCLAPALQWKTLITEIKLFGTGERIGYDLTERLRRPSRIAILPVGYWHGLDRGLSSRGRALVRGIVCKFLGRVSMDMITLDVTDVPGVRPGDEVTLIGKDKNEEITAQNIADQLGTIQYEVITRINPLIERVVK